MAQAVLLDSGFLIRLMNPDEPLHDAALSWFRQFVELGFIDIRHHTPWPSYPSQ